MAAAAVHWSSSVGQPMNTKLLPRFSTEYARPLQCGKAASLDAS